MKLNEHKNISDKYSMQEILKIENSLVYNDDCVNVMQKIFNDKSTVDLTVTSPPYDELRTYNNSSEWNFDTFKSIAQGLWNITVEGGVVVWIVGDSTTNGGESGSSFRQALYFMEIGFKLHDTMIFEKNSSSFPAKRNGKRYYIQLPKIMNKNENTNNFFKSS